MIRLRRFCCWQFVDNIPHFFDIQQLLLVLSFLIILIELSISISCGPGLFENGSSIVSVKSSACLVLSKIRSPLGVLRGALLAGCFRSSLLFNLYIIDLSSNFSGLVKVSHSFCR